MPHCLEMWAGANTSWGQPKSQRKSQGRTEIWWDACSAGPQIHTDSFSSWAAWNEAQLISGGDYPSSCWRVSLRKHTDTTRASPPPVTNFNDSKKIVLTWESIHPSPWVALKCFFVAEWSTSRFLWSHCGIHGIHSWFRHDKRKSERMRKQRKKKKGYSGE